MTTPLARRDSYLDGLRGAFHVWMLFDHLPILFPGILSLFAWTFECAGYVTVAEGFMFLSGYVTGLVYTRVRSEAGERALWRKAVIRAFVIYSTYVVAIVLLMALVRIGGSAGIEWGRWTALMEGSLSCASIQVAALTIQPTFLEILPMYSLFLLLTPPALGQLERRRLWLIALVSTSVWVVEQFNFPAQLFSGWELGGYFHAAGWQALFFGGLICGYKSYSSNGPWLPRRIVFPILAYVIVVVCFGLRHDVFGIHLDLGWTNRSRLGPLRLLNFACAVYLVARFRGLIEPLIAWRGLAFLSRHSLQAFAFHLVPIYIAALLFTQRTTMRWQTQLLFGALCVAGLFEIAWLSEHLKRWWRHRSRPAPLQPKVEPSQ